MANRIIYAITKANWGGAQRYVYDLAVAAKAQGYEVGVSLISKELPSADVLNNPHFVSPVDVTVERPDKQARVKTPAEVAEDEKIVDIGEKTEASLTRLIEESSFIVWNGPSGIFEEGFIGPTAHIAKKIATSSAQSIVGGGDTLAAIRTLNLFDKFSFVSTGGGAMLHFLAEGTLPGIEVLGGVTK